MSVSTDGLLFYGICPTGIDLSFPGYEPTPDEKLSRDPWQRFYTRWTRARWEWQEKIEADYGITWGIHCSDSAPMPYLAITSTLVKARRGYPKPIAPEAVPVLPSWDTRLRRFCQDMELPYEQPQWWLASYWG